MAINPIAMPPKTEAPSPEIAPESLTGMKQYPFLKEQQAAGEKAVEARVKAGALKESTALEEKGKALEQIGAQDKAYYEDVKSKMEKPPEFKPTQENAMELGAIFSLIGTMGVSLGGSGKLSGLNALNAMGGMLKGWQQGKKDVFAKEQTIFDKEVARIKSANDMLLKDLEQYQKLRISDKEAAMVKSQEIASKNPGVIASLIEAGKSDVAYEIAKKNTDIHAEILKLSEKNRVSANGGMLPKDAKTKEDYKVKYLASRNIDEIMDLLNDPQVSRLITPATKFTPDFIQNLRERFPELGPKLARVQAIEFETGGKSLTKNEREVLEPIYGWKGIGVDALRTRLTEAKQNIDNNLALNEVTYPGFKPLREQFDKVYMVSGKVPDIPGETKQDVDTLRSQAKARIAAGGDEDAVRARFKELTGKEL
jgi:hypothetical protein